MEDLLKKEPVQRVVKVLSNFDESIKVKALSSSAKTAKDAAISLKCEVGAIVKSLLLRTENNFILCLVSGCLLYTSDAADDSLRVDLGGRRIIKMGGWSYS